MMLYTILIIVVLIYLLSQQIVVYIVLSGKLSPDDLHKTYKEFGINVFRNLKY